MDLLFNYGLTDITPEEPVALAGFANRKGFSGKIHRSLTSRCVVFRQDQKTVCLIVNDLMDVDPEIVTDMMKRISARTGLDTDSIIICSIHTHSAPEMEHGRHPANDRYIKLATEKITENASLLIGNHAGFQKATISYGRATCGINIARRDVKPKGGGMAYRVGDEDGLRDEEVGILQFSDDTGEKKVTLINYACHPVTLGYESNWVSTDYPGKAREMVEMESGGMAIFLNGASGDLNPREAHHADPAKTDEAGMKLGASVLSAKLERHSGEMALKVLAANIRIPFRDSNITKEHIAQEAERKARDITEFFTWQKMLDRWKDKIFEKIDRGEVKPYFPLKANAWQIGRAVLFFTQGELFVKYQVELKRLFPQYHIFCIAYAHGTGAYITTSDVFEKKGYETDQAYIYELLPSPLSDRIEDVYNREVTSLIKSLTERD